MDRREDRLRQAILGDAAHELRPDAVADGEQEHEERKRLEGLRDGDPDLPDQDAGQQGGGDRPQADTLERELAEVVPEAEREEDRDLGVLTQRREEPVDHASSALRARVRASPHPCAVSYFVRCLASASGFRSSRPFPAL